MTTQGQRTPESNRASIIASIQALVSDGTPLRRACAEVGVNHNSFYRWTRDVAPLQDYRPAAPKGRPSKFQFTEAETRRLRFWHLVKGSIPLAVESFLAEAMTGDESPYLNALREANASPTDTGTRARPELANALRAHWQQAVQARKSVVWPLSVQRACRTTQQEQAQFRGQKHASDARGMERRGNLIVLPDGEKVAWYAGAIWESDDMSLNEPFRFHDAASGQEMTGRQMLATIDAYSLHYLGHDLIGRDRDSYRAEDIANHFRSLVAAHGLPLIWRIEKGRWDNNFIWGVKIGEDAEGQDIRWGGLDAIIHIRDKFTSQGKANIEGSFDLMQAISAHGFNGQTQSIGRSRGEFESGTRQMLRANRDNPDAAALAQFWGIADAADAVARAMHLFNQRPKKRHNFDNQTIIPAQLWAECVKRPCPADHLWRFCAVKTTATVRRGILEVKAPHYPQSFRFRVHGGSRTPNVHCDNGHEVLVAFTPNEAWEGCHVFNADKSARNRDGWGWLEKMGVADFMADAPQEDLHAKAYSPGANRAAAQVRRETRLILTGSNFSGKRVSHAQDSFGNQLTQSTAGAESETIPVTPGRALGADESPAEASRRDTCRKSGVTAGETAPRSNLPTLRLASTPRQSLADAADDLDADEELAALSL